MTEFVMCPGDCESKVILHPGNVVNFCCHNCWRWYWDNGVMRTVPMGANDQFLPRHSEKCQHRQLSRVNEPIVEGVCPNWNTRNTPPEKEAIG